MSRVAGVFQERGGNVRTRSKPLLAELALYGAGDARPKKREAPRGRTGGAS